MIGPVDFSGACPFSFSSAEKSHSVKSVIKGDLFSVLETCTLENCVKTAGLAVVLHYRPVISNYSCFENPGIYFHSRKECYVVTSETILGPVNFSGPLECPLC